jgi:plasmid replication initiation protein
MIKKKTDLIPAIKVDDQISDRLLKKAVELIHMSGNLTLSQKKIFNHLIAYAFKDLGTTDVYRANVVQLVKDTSFDSKNMEALRGTLQTIQKTLVSLDLLNDSGQVKGHADINLLSQTHVLNGIITYSFPPALRLLLNDPKVFAIISLSTEDKFKSVHTLNLYETILRFRKVRSTGFIALPIWRKLIGATDPCYEVFKVFNYSVLKPSIKEINEKCEVFIEAFFEKSGRNVVAIRFEITEKSKMKDVEDEPEVENDDLDPECVTVKTRLLALGLSEKDVMAIIGDHQLDYIDGNLCIVETRIRTALKNQDKSKHIKPEKYAVYLKKALKEDWRQGTVSFDKKLQDEKKELIAKELEAKQQEALAKAKIAEMAKSRANHARDNYNEMSPVQQSDMHSKFVEAMRDANNVDVIKKFLKDGVDASKLVSTCFEQWLIKEMGL